MSERHYFDTEDDAGKQMVVNTDEEGNTEVELDLEDVDGETSDVKDKESN